MSVVEAVMASDAFSLLRERWLPVRRRSGARAWIALHQIVDRVEDDPVVRPDWGRADLHAATLEFLISLLAVACPPTGMADWKRRYLNPPSPDALAKAFEPFAHAFLLDSDPALMTLPPLKISVFPTPVGMNRGVDLNAVSVLSRPHAPHRRHSDIPPRPP